MKHKKEKEATEMIAAQLARHTRPIVLWSSGKDSSVVLHLTLRLKTVPVMWWRLARFQEKQVFGNWMARQWGLEVYDATPYATRELQHEDWFEVMHFYGNAEAGTIGMTTGVVPYEEQKPFLCAVDDLLMRPRCRDYQMKWDLALQGHRETEIPYFGQSQTITTPVTSLGTTTLCNPIYNWTEEEVWSYIRRYDIPYDKKRYRSGNQEGSPDHYRTCWRCLDYRKAHDGATVFCPKFSRDVEAIARPQAEHDQFLAALKTQVKHVEYTGAPLNTVSPHV